MSLSFIHVGYIILIAFSNVDNNIVIVVGRFVIFTKNQYIIRERKWLHVKQLIVLQCHTQGLPYRFLLTMPC